MTSGVDLLSQGDAMFSAKDYPGAVNAYRQVLDQNPMLGAAYVKLTVALTAIGDFPGAVDSGAKSVAFAPRELDAKYAYAYALARLDRFPEAVEQLDSILAENTHRDDARTLLLWALHQAGAKLAADDPHDAERYLDRARKLRPDQSEPVVALLNLYADSQQHGKITRLISGLGKQAQDPVISSAIEKIANLNPDVKRAVDQGTVSARTQGPVGQPVATPNRAAVQYVPCPSCKRSVADFAAICPHCGHQIKATGTFAGRDTGPAYAWQDVALTITLVLKIILDGVRIYSQWIESKQAADMAFQMTVAISGAGILLSLLCIFRNELALNILKYILYANLLFGSLGLAVLLMVGAWVPALINAAVIAIAGFLLYLIHWASD